MRGDFFLRKASFLFGAFKSHQHLFFQEAQRTILDTDETLHFDLRMFLCLVSPDVHSR